MPTHWESSEGPLFVKTVIVNGSRHAILSQVDPLCQAKRSDGPAGVCHSCATSTTVGYLDVKDERRARSSYQPKRDISSDLQKCLVKLRVALSTQESKKKAKMQLRDEEKSESGVESENWRNVRRSLEKVRKGNKSAECGSVKEDGVMGFRKGNSFASMLKAPQDDCIEPRDVSDGTAASSELEIEDPPANPATKSLPLTEATEQLLKNYPGYFFPIVYLKANNITWDEVSGDGSVPKNFGNPLSERVLQWLDLARRRKESLGSESADAAAETSEQIAPASSSDNVKRAIGKVHNRKYKVLGWKCEKEGAVTAKERPPCDNGYVIRRFDGNEDVEEEVRQECDVETVLSSTAIREYPKYSRELNKHHVMKPPQGEADPQSDSGSLDPQPPSEGYWVNSILSIPEKSHSDLTITEQLQQSILSSFEAIVNLERSASMDSAHFARKQSLRDAGNIPAKLARRKGLLVKQTNIRMSSDEDDRDGETVLETRRRSKSYRSLNEHRKKAWDHKKKFRHNGGRMGSNDENREPAEEGSREVRVLYNDVPLSLSDRSSLPGDRGGRRVWAVEKGASKPQLHIFMPEVSPKVASIEAGEESGSDTESFSK